MFAALRPPHYYLLLTYLLLTAVPFVPMLQGRPLADPWQVLGMAVVGWIAAWAVFKRPAWFHWLLIPAFLALPVELYLFIHYSQGMSTHHLGILAETSPMEAMEYLGSTVWLLAGVLLGVVAWFFSTWKVARATRALDWDDSSRTVTLVMLALLACLWAYGHHYGIAAPKSTVPASAKYLPPLPRWAQLPFELTAFAQSWPFGVSARGVDFYQERRHLARLGERSSTFRFGTRQANPDSLPEVVVMVIGESSRFDRWQLNGYARPTNPLLSQEPNLVTLPDIITSVSATRLSVPVMISRKPVMQSLKDGFAEKSFISAYQEAGFKTFWLSNQISFGKYDTPVSVFAKEADVVAYLNLGGFTNQSTYDEVLLVPFANALRDPAPKKLIVLHTLGSHWNYSQRYPTAFDRWQPSLHGVDKPVVSDVRIRERMSNSYDSSILYTDWFLANVIKPLKESSAGSGVRSSMLYVADHGQTLYDGSCKQAFHGHNSQFEFHVPGLVWYSDRYAAHYPDKVARLHANHGARLSMENVFHTVLDLGDIRYAGESLQRSFVNASFAPHKRYVDSYGWADYDNATFRGDCREVIDKGKPLKRQK